MQTGMTGNSCVSSKPNSKPIQPNMKTFIPKKSFKRERMRFRCAGTEFYYCNIHIYLMQQKGF